MRLLVIRLSALGDIVHALPALTDLRRALPEATIHFAVDERFAELARLHGHVDQVISLPLKRWKRSPLKWQTWQELTKTLKTLRQTTYDQVIDVHGINKSAIVASLVRTHRRSGPDRAFSPDWLPTKIYDHRCLPDGWTPRTQWIRQIAAQALDIPLNGPADFGLKRRWQATSNSPVVMVTNTAGPERMWDHEQWVALGRTLTDKNLRLIFPWGTTLERQRVKALTNAIGSPNCVEGPAQSISAWASELGRARLVVGVDTGLLHIAAAVGTPCVGIFTTSDPGLLISQNPQWASTVGGPRQPRASHSEALVKIQHILNASQGALAPCD